jgi:hypothetical protein
MDAPSLTADFGSLNLDNAIRWVLHRRWFVPMSTDLASPGLSTAPPDEDYPSDSMLCAEVARIMDDARRKARAPADAPAASPATDSS